MRDHLDRCFLQKRMEMFLHVTKQAPSTRSEYVVSVYCICLMHIPGAPMVHCNVCNNWFHHGPSQQCIKLSAKQAAALATELPFVWQKQQMKEVLMQCIAKWNIIATYPVLVLLKYSVASCIMPFYLKWWISKKYGWSIHDHETTKQKYVGIDTKFCLKLHIQHMRFKLSLYRMCESILTFSLIPLFYCNRV